MDIKDKLVEILHENGKKIVAALKQSLTDNDRVATGKTRDSITYEIQGTALVIFGASHILALEDGRKPTGEGDGTAEKGGFFEQVQEWAFARSIPEEFHYAIYVSVNEKGFEGTEGLLSTPVNTGLRDLNGELHTKLNSVILIEIEKIFDKK